MRKFSMVSPKLWDSPRFHALGSDDARYLYVYLLTCKHQTTAGAFSLPIAYGAADLRWSVDRLAKALQQLVDGGMIVHDPETQEIFVLRWFRHNTVAKGKHRQGVERIICELDSDRVREAAEADLIDLDGPKPDGADDYNNPIPDPPGRHPLTSTAYMTGRRW